MKGHMTVGLDNGLDGAAVALGSLGNVIGSFVMPTVKITKVSKAGKTKTNREIDALKFFESLESLIPDRSKAIIVFEECPHHSKSKSSMRGMAINAGKILGVLESRGYTLERIMSTDWQPVVLGKAPQGKTKEYALAKAKELWPDETWAHNKKDWHAGKIDAALIAHFTERL